MKSIENEKVLIVDTEDDNRPFSRFYVFMKDSTKVYHYGLKDIELNLYDAFDSFDKYVAEICLQGNLIKG